MKKYIKYLFLLIWTLVFIINVFIKGNYKNYNILSYIIIAIIFSIPFIIIKLKLIKLPTKQKAHINNSVQPVAQPPKAFSRKDYPEAFLNNEYRIITESIEVVQNTKNIETLCNRYKLAMEHSLNINNQQYIETLKTNYTKYISDCYDKYVGEVKNETAKQNRKQEFLTTLQNCLSLGAISDFKNGKYDIDEAVNSNIEDTSLDEELLFQFILKYHNEIYAVENNVHKTSYIRIDMKTPKFSDDYTIKDLIETCNDHINAYESLRHFCYSKGKGGEIYFQIMWEYCRDSRHDSMRYTDNIVEYKEILLELLQDKDRIITNSLEIIESTDNIDELCKYYDIALKHATDTNNQNYISELSTKHLSYILDCYDKYIGAVKTEKAKQNRKIKFFETLNNYLDKETIEAFDDMLSN